MLILAALAHVSHLLAGIALAAGLVFNALDWALSTGESGEGWE